MRYKRENYGDQAKHRMLVANALQIAAKTHKNQFRNGPSQLPYLNHCFEVLKLVSRWIVDTTLYEVALLHDVIEEGGELNNSVSEKAEKAVHELTLIERDASILSYNQQKQAYLDSFGSKSLPALVVKVADRICNINEFLEGDASSKDYATKYTDKAKNLFETAVKRKEEIDKEYGPDLHKRMCWHISVVQTTIMELKFEKDPNATIQELQCSS